MNRAEKRRLAKQGIKGEIEETMTLDNYIDLYTLSFLMAMDSCDIDKEKIHEVIAKVFETMECFISGNLNKKDVLVMAREEFGIELVDNVKNKIYVVNGKLVKV